MTNSLPIQCYPTESILVTVIANTISHKRGLLLTSINEHYLSYLLIIRANLIGFSNMGFHLKSQSSQIALHNYQGCYLD